MKRVHLFPRFGEPVTASGLSEDLIRVAACALAYYLCNGTEGRAEGDPVYEWVTEGRKSGNTRRRAAGSKEVSYSECGDLVHTVLWCLGCRDEKLVNRTADGGKVPWAMGANLTRIAYHKAFLHPKPQMVVLAGDVLYVNNTDHVCIIGTTEANETATITTFDYAQFRVNPGPPKKVVQAFEKKKLLSHGEHGLLVDERPMRGVLSLSLVDFTESAIVPDDFPFGVADDSPYEEISVDGKMKLVVEAGVLPRWVVNA